ncbi:PAS domain-containing protein [Aestuariivirga sp.]|uniref:PAS domain-containing protein n=1 Tax=Aestuariivirga sp. TaxID=2650926 RepID=UPI003919C26B
MWVKGEAQTSQEDKAIQHPWSRMLFRFWEATRAERSAPHRHDLDLKQIRALVPYLFIAEQPEGTLDFRWRLAGTGICHLYGRELTGKPFLTGWDDFEAAVIHRFLGAVTGMHQPALLRLRLGTVRGQTLTAEMAAFPVLASDEVNTHVLGGLFPFADPSHDDPDGLATFELQSARLVWTETIPPAIEGANAAPPARPRFHVIAGGRSRG